ncbi:MAG: DUF4381 domain-containing protein [Myxococcota bacterium]
MAGSSAGDPMWGLRELPRPEAISWVPQTYGWGLVVLTLVLGLTCIALRGYRVWRRQAYRRLAETELSEIARDNARLTHLPALLRRAALSAFPRQEVANLHGSEWIDWLNREGASFLPDDARWLDQLAYDPQLAEHLETESATRLIASSRQFIRSHRARV